MDDSARPQTRPGPRATRAAHLDRLLHGRVEGRTVDGTSVIVVVTLMSEEHIGLITVFPDD